MQRNPLRGAARPWRWAARSATYAHARQFPHLAGLDDARIREVVIRGMGRRPGLVRVHKLRNAAVVIGMLLATALLARLSSLNLGMIMGLVGAVATAFILCWNLVWVNTVLYRVTLEEVGRGPV
jgi:hypothetical protein